MWFRLAFYPGRSDLVAVVGLDKKIYFKADDVGRFLGYSNPYQFSKQHAKKTLKPDFLKGNYIDLYVFEFHEMLSVMQKAFHSFSNVSHLEYLYNQGYVENINSIVQTDWRYAPRLTVQEEVGPIKLKDWILNYMDLCLKRYVELLGSDCLYQTERMIRTLTPYPTNSISAESSSYPANPVEGTNQSVLYQLLTTSPPPPPAAAAVENPPPAAVAAEHPPPVWRPNLEILGNIRDRLMEANRRMERISRNESSSIQLEFNEMSVPDEIKLIINGELHLYVKEF